MSAPASIRAFGRKFRASYQSLAALFTVEPSSSSSIFRAHAPVVIRAASIFQEARDGDFWNQHKF